MTMPGEMPEQDGFKREAQEHVTLSDLIDRSRKPKALVNPSLRLSELFTIALGSELCQDFALTLLNAMDPKKPVTTETEASAQLEDAAKGLAGFAILVAGHALKVEVEALRRLGAEEVERADP